VKDHLSTLPVAVLHSHHHGNDATATQKYSKKLDFLSFCRDSGFDTSEPQLSISDHEGFAVRAQIISVGARPDACNETTVEIKHEYGTNTDPHCP